MKVLKAQPWIDTHMLKRFHAFHDLKKGRCSRILGAY
jgi:hypothetical protein